MSQRTSWIAPTRTNAALGAQVEPVEPPPLEGALALAAARASRSDLVGVDLLPTGNGFVVLELNGAVDFRPVYARRRDVFADTVAALLGPPLDAPSSPSRQPDPSGSYGCGRRPVSTSRRP